MTREEKVWGIMNMVKASSIIFLKKKINLSCGKGDIIDNRGLYEEIDGDWVLKGTFRPCGYVPCFTDRDIDKMYKAVQKWAEEVLSGKFEY